MSALRLVYKTSRSWLVLILSAALLVLGSDGCESCNKQECVDKSKPELDQCKLNQDKLQAEINALKRQLAQALANPGTIKVDPSVLVIDGKPIKVAAREGSLSQEQVVLTMQQNRGVLTACYERAMKKNTSLTHQRVTLNVGFQVAPSGVPQSITISPNYDSLMMDCMKKAIMRWRFPPFSGQPVGVETPITLQPRK
jgi:hypothetical protein